MNLFKPILTLVKNFAVIQKEIENERLNDQLSKIQTQNSKLYSIISTLSYSIDELEKEKNSCSAKEYTDEETFNLNKIVQLESERESDRLELEAAGKLYEKTLAELKIARSSQLEITSNSRNFDTETLNLKISSLEAERCNQNRMIDSFKQTVKNFDEEKMELIAEISDNRNETEIKLKSVALKYSRQVESLNEQIQVLKNEKEFLRSKISGSKVDQNIIDQYKKA